MKEASSEEIINTYGRYLHELTDIVHTANQCIECLRFDKLIEFEIPETCNQLNGKGYVCVDCLNLVSKVTEYNFNYTNCLECKKQYKISLDLYAQREREELLGKCYCRDCISKHYSAYEMRQFMVNKLIPFKCDACEELISNIQCTVINSNLYHLHPQNCEECKVKNNFVYTEFSENGDLWVGIKRFVGNSYVYYIMKSKDKNKVKDSMALFASNTYDSAVECGFEAELRKQEIFTTEKNEYKFT
jgi:hypothetical protein